jgi:glycosyltransferase involved in cell wall biosynthesis
MKIAKVTFRFDAPGGVETNVRAIASALRARGQDVEIFTSDVYDEPRWERRSDFSPTVDGVPVHRYPAYKKLIPHLTLPLLPGLITGLSDFEPDIIHAHSHRYGHVLEAAVVARERRRPLIVSLHYHPADHQETQWKRGLLRLQDFGFGASAYRVAHALVVETKQEADRVSEFAPSDRIHIIPPGIHLAAWKEKNHEHEADLPDRYILYAGRVASNKGLAILLRAYAQIPASLRIPLVILGRDWGERAGLEALAQSLEIRREILWLGHVDDEARYRRVFWGASLFALPSEYEAFGLVLLEAMAAEVPIVASAVGGVPEVLESGRSGRLVPYGRVDAWTRALSELLEDRPQRQGLVRAGRDRVEGLTWGHSADLHVQLYHEVLEKGP